jgi:uncharacterized paraquat-inducible protein A
MTRKLLGVLVAGGLVIAVTGWLLYPWPGQNANQNFRFMHCPHCGLEVPYNANTAGRPCPRCGPDFVLEPTTEAVAVTGGPPNPFARMLGPILLELNVLMVAVWCVTRPSRPGAARLDYRHMRCSRCKKKLRYLTHKAGNKAQCPRCKHSLVLAGTEDMEDD